MLSAVRHSPRGRSTADSAHARAFTSAPRDADLTGANLAEADLIAANLGGAILTGANLHEADLLGADLTNAKCSAEDFKGALHVPARTKN